jgi:hypothetical protein
VSSPPPRLKKQVGSSHTFHLTDLLWHIWLLYYYLSIALRENILKANGSEIHGWWFMHHYISMVPLTSRMFPSIAVV